VGRGLRAEALRYVVGGTVTTVLSLGLYYLLQLVLQYQVAYAIAFVVGVAIAYGINVGYVFRARHTAAKAMAFPLVYLAQYVIGALLLAVLVEWLGVPQEIAPLPVAIVTIPVSFVLARVIVKKG
jgi:putative flippase GtrA